MDVRIQKLVLNYIKKHGDTFEHDEADALLREMSGPTLGPVTPGVAGTSTPPVKVDPIVGGK